MAGYTIIVVVAAYYLRFLIFLMLAYISTFTYSC
jgi:hypothetical protein